MVDQVEAPGLTEEIKNNGVILVYYRDSPGGDFAKQLPSNFYVSGELIFTLEYVAKIGEIEILHGPSAHPDGKGIDELLPSSQARYILIPGGEPAKLSSDFYEDYRAVIEYFGIPE